MKWTFLPIFWALASCDTWGDPLAHKFTVQNKRKVLVLKCLERRNNEKIKELIIIKKKVSFVQFVNSPISGITISIAYSGSDNMSYCSIPHYNKAQENYEYIKRILDQQ
jgi:hypothetical protein